MITINRFVKDRLSDFIFLYRKLTGSAETLKDGCRILMYHSVENSDPHKDRMGLAVPPDVFRMQMEYLKENGFHVIGLNDFVQRVRQELPIPKRSVAITFDDGYRSILTNASPVLQRQGFAATLFVNIHFVERKLSRDAYWYDWQTLSWDEVRKLSENGMLIGSHGVTHRRLSELSCDEISSEITRSKEIIENNINKPVSEFSYPQGSFNKEAMEILQNNGFVCACSSLCGINEKESDMFALKRTEITAFDDTPVKFGKKVSGCYDWLSIAGK